MIAAETAQPLAQIVEALPEQSGFALVAMCPSDAADQLRRVSALPVTEAHDRLRLEADRLFVIPPDCDGAFHRDELVVMPAGDPRTSIDKLLRSLADTYGAEATAVVVDLRGNDGVLGIRRLKEVGGLTIARLPDDHNGAPAGPALASFATGMTGMIDLSLPLSVIGERLVSLARDPVTAVVPDDRAAGAHGEPPGPDATADSLHDILTLMRRRSGHDFGSYKRATLYRRVSRRMQVCQCGSIAGYLHYLRDHPGELAHLLSDFLISVTNFFRDREVFDALATSVVPRLFAGKSSGDQVRVWVAGCATGEEAYSVAMLLADHASQLCGPPQLQVFATDIDEDALAEARLGRYPATIAVDVSAERLQRFFSLEADHYRVTRELREIVLFSPHNVLRDPPFSRLDLITCRNLLIYLNRDAQDRVLNVFHFGLRPDGFLLLGSSESAENTAVFAGLDTKHRIFVRRPSASRLITDSIISNRRRDPPPPQPAAAPPLERTAAGQLHHQLVERLAPPSVLVNEELDILHVSERAGRLLQVTGGEPSRQLLRLIHPALQLDLRTAIHAARQSARGSATRRVRFNEDGRPRAIELRVRAVNQPELGPNALLVMFDELDPEAEADVAPTGSAALEPVMRDLEDELRRTRDQLRTTIEQYETSLEELKASNEELQAINEELRSATEELETSKEELQSMNEELTTVNHELKLKVDEISHANADLQNLITSTDIGVVFLDRGLNIKRFTPRVRDLINVIPSDIGRPLAHLTHRLETEDLPGLAQSVLQTLRTVEREIRSRDGRRYLARLLPYRSLEDRIGGVVLTFVEVSDLRNAVDARRRSEVALQASEDRLRFALRTAPMIVVNLDDDLRLTWGYLLGTELAAETPALFELFARGEADRFTEITRRLVRDGGGLRAELDLVIGGEPRTYDFRIERTELGISAVGFDITPSKLAEASLRDSDRRKDEFLATLSHELRNPLTPLQVALDVARLAIHEPARLEQAHAIMRRQVVKLTQLVDDLLDLSRITRGKISIAQDPVDPVLVVEAALEATRPLFQQRNHELRVELPSLPTRVLGDHARLTQVLTNLLNNAAKYTPNGGHIELALDTDPMRNVLTIDVRDDGEGIAADMLPEIFEIFVQCRDAEGRMRSGLGIGLNLVRRLIELHGGRVSASSAGLGHGTQFHVELPTVIRAASMTARKLSA